MSVDQCIFTGDTSDTVQLALNGMPESECGSSHQFDPTTFMFKNSLSGGLDTCGTVVDYGSNGELIFRAVFKNQA